MRRSGDAGTRAGTKSSRWGPTRARLAYTERELWEIAAEPLDDPRA